VVKRNDYPLATVANKKKCALGSFALKVGLVALIIKKYLNEHNKYCN
jgi:hypothetical protein